MFRCPYPLCRVEFRDGSPEYSAWYNIWRSAEVALQRDCPICKERLFQCNICGFTCGNVQRGARSPIRIINRHISTCNQKEQAKKRKADGSTVVLIDDCDGDGDHYYDDDDNDDAVSVQSDSYCYSGDIMTKAVSEMKDQEQAAGVTALSYTEGMYPLDMNPILHGEQIVIACEEEEEDEPMQDTISSIPVPELPYTSFNSFAKIYSPNVKEGEHNQKYWARSSNQDYFFQLHKHKLNNPESNAGGWLGLVQRANTGDRENWEMADEKEAQCLFRLTKLLLKMPDPMKEDLMKYQEELFDLLQLRKHHIKLSTRIPTNVREMRRLITEGQQSVLKNFPVQDVFEINGHACVSLEETLRLMLGHGATPLYAYEYDGQTGGRNKEGLNGTKAMDDLIKEANDKMRESGIEDHVRIRTKIGWLLFWSDGFLRCFIKQKDNSIWLLTVTVCPPENMKSSHLYTHVLAMGRHDADHTPVIEHYMKEAGRLVKGYNYYCGHSNKLERISFPFLAWNADRPECQSLTNTRKEGNYGKISQWAANVSEDRLPACRQCYIFMMTKLAGRGVRRNGNIERQCTKCANWSLVRNKDGAQIEECMNDLVSKDCPKHYPDPETTDVDPQPEGRTSFQTKLPPKKLSTEWMLQVVRAGYFGVNVGKWPVDQAREYFKTCNLKTSKGEEIIQLALLDQKDGVIDASKVEPLFWKQIDCFGSFKFPNLPLHGLCHGMIPDVMSIIHQVFKKYKKMQSFVDYANPILETLSSFGLDFMKVKSLPKAAWIGENCLAYSRLMTFLYGSYLMRDDALGDSDEARVIKPFLRCLINSFQVLMSIFMTRTAPSKDIIDDHIKLFMSSAHYLHKQHGMLDTSEKARDTKTPNEKPRDFLKKQPRPTLIAMLDHLGVKYQDTFTSSELVNRLMGVRLVDMKHKLPTSNGPSVRTKIDAYKLICQISGGTSGIDNGDDTSGSTNAKSKKEKMCWNKGNWLSFMANIARQIEYLGPLHLIWYVRISSGPRQTTNHKPFFLNLIHLKLTGRGGMRG